MQNNIMENKAVINLAYNFTDVVRKNNWVSRYDQDTDSFSFTVRRLPNDARLKYFGNEFAFYITGKGQVKGIFIEYFNKNFIEHNKDISEIKKIFKDVAKKQKNREYSLIEVENSKLNTKIIKGLENSLEESFARGLNLQPA